MSSTKWRLAKGIWVVGLGLSLLGCATTGTRDLPPEVPPRHSAEEFKDDRIAYVPDPWERFNKKMYRFNFYLDKYLLLPVVRGYEFVTPVFVQDRVSNFFNNLGEISNLTNSLLQFKGKESAETLGRFLTNSTIGLGGLFDPATPLGLDRHPEDFGLTLAHWGAGPGNYLVLPAFGPSSVRDAGGLVVDGGMAYGIYSLVDPLRSVDQSFAISVGIATLDVIDTRHQQPFRYFDSGYPFEYYMVHFLVNQRREMAVSK